MRQQTRTRTPALDRARGQRCQGEAIAAGAGHAGPHDAVHDVEPMPMAARTSGAAIGKSAIGPRSRQWCAIGSSPMAAARGRERIPALRSHLRPTGAVCRRIGRKPRWPGSVRPRCAGCDPGSVGASACRPVRHRAGAALPSSRRWRSRAPLSSELPAAAPSVRAPLATADYGALSKASCNCSAVSDGEEHRQLRRGQRDLAVLGRGPDKPALLQPLGELPLERHWSERQWRRKPPLAPLSLGPMARQWLTHQMILIRSPCRPRSEARARHWSERRAERTYGPLSVNALHSPAGQWLKGLARIVCPA